MEVVSDGVLVDLREAAFLRADGTGEVAEVVDREGDVGVERLAHRLAVVPRLRDGDLLEVLLHPVGDPVEDECPLRGRGLVPRRCRRPCRVEGGLDVLGGAAAHLAERLAGDRGGVLEVLPLLRRDPFAADEVLVALLELDLGALGSRVGVDRHRSFLSLSPRDVTRGCVMCVTLRRAALHQRCTARATRSAGVSSPGADECRAVRDA